LPQVTNKQPRPPTITSAASIAAAINAADAAVPPPPVHHNMPPPATITETGRWSAADWYGDWWHRSSDTWTANHGGGRTWEHYRHGWYGGRQRYGTRGGHDHDYYAGYYRAKGKGMGHLRAYLAQKGPPPTRGGDSFHDRKEDADVETNPSPDANVDNDVPNDDDKETPAANAAFYWTWTAASSSWTRVPDLR